MLILCRHNRTYAAQPDEAALVAFAQRLGVECEVRELRREFPGGVAVRRVLWDTLLDRWYGDIVERTA